MVNREPQILLSILVDTSTSQMRGLIIAPTYPISEQKIIGTWAHQQAKAIQRQETTIDVVSPVPRVYEFPGCSDRVQRWASIPKRKRIDGVTVHYPRTLSYPIAPFKRAYSNIPKLEGWLTWFPIRSYLTDLFETNDYDFIIAHNPMPAGYIGSKLAGQFETTLAVVFHSYVDLDASESNEGLRTIFTEVASSADVVVTVSEMMKNKLEPIYSGDITIVRNGFDPDEVNATQSMSEGLSRIDLANQKLILSVGSLTERKGHMYLLEAFNELVRDDVFEQDDCVCLIVGSGPEKGRLEEYVNQHDLEDCVVFQSGLDRDEVNTLMKSADVFVLPSWNEPCATVFSETMAYGTPMIMVRGEGFSELITDRETGMLVPPRDSQSLSTALREILTDGELSDRIERRSQMVSHSRLKWNQNAATLLETIERSATSSQ